MGINWLEMDLRQYDPTIARWTSNDPVVHHSLYPYIAFDNNPVFWADPSGANSESIFLDQKDDDDNEEDYIILGNGFKIPKWEWERTGPQYFAESGQNGNSTNIGGDNCCPNGSGTEEDPFELDPVYVYGRNILGTIEGLQIGSAIRAVGVEYFDLQLQKAIREFGRSKELLKIDAGLKYIVGPGLVALDVTVIGFRARYDPSYSNTEAGFDFAGSLGSFYVGFTYTPGWGTVAALTYQGGKSIVTGTLYSREENRKGVRSQRSIDNNAVIRQNRYDLSNESVEYYFSGEW